MLLKAMLGAFLTVLFLAAFWVANSLGHRIGQREPRILLKLTIWTACGVVLGLVLTCIRVSAGVPIATAAHLIWLHAVGFALAFVAGRTSVHLLRRKMPDVSSP